MEFSFNKGRGLWQSNSLNLMVLDHNDQEIEVFSDKVRKNNTKFK